MNEPPALRARSSCRAKEEADAWTGNLVSLGGRSLPVVRRQTTAVTDVDAVPAPVAEIEVPDEPDHRHEDEYENAGEPGDRPLVADDELDEEKGDQRDAAGGRIHDGSFPSRTSLTVSH